MPRLPARTIVLGEVGQEVRHIVGALGKLLKLKHSQRPVPQNGLGVLERSGNGLGGLGSNIKTLAEGGTKGCT